MSVTFSLTPAETSSSLGVSLDPTDSSVLVEPKPFLGNPGIVDQRVEADSVRLTNAGGTTKGSPQLVDDDEEEGGDTGVDSTDSDAPAPGTPGFGDDLDDSDDDLDEFDDIDEDDFDDDFDDDFEEELDDDYEIEIDDEISAEFGLNTAGEDLSDDDDDLDDFEDFDAVD